MKERNYFVYILANKYNTTLYIGVTNNLLRRLQEHKLKLIDGFTKKYNLDKLVYYEVTNSVEDALNREKQLKAWKSQWKIDLIKTINPEFKDLSEEIDS